MSESTIEEVAHAADRPVTLAAIIGGGHGCKAILDLVSQGKLAALNLEVLCVVDPDPDAPGVAAARELGIPSLRSLHEALRFEGLELIIELTGKDEILADLYRLTPPGVRIMDHRLARVFWDLNEVFQGLRERLQEKTDLEARLKESVQRFEQFVNAAQDIIVLKDLGGRYLFINRVAAALFGRRPEEFVGKTDRMLFDPVLAERFEKRDKAFFQAGRTVSREESLVLGGRKIYLHTVRFPLLDHKGQVMGVGVISRDVTEQKRLQRSLIQSEKLAAVGKLAAGIAHEINNPLSGIITFVEDLLIDVDPADPVRRDYEVIYREALRCRQIVRDLLDYTRLQHPVRQGIDLNTVIRRAHGLVSKQAAFRNVDFDFRLSAGPVEVHADPGQMQQVILNLVMNAAEAMDGKGTITIASGLSGTGRRVFFEVADTGCGIPKDQIEKIFEPFYSTKGARGNGLGLSVVQSIVDQHGGRIHVRSAVGQGTSFRIELPAREAAS